MAGGTPCSQPRWRSCSQRSRCDGGSLAAGPSPGAPARHHEDTDIAVRIGDLFPLRRHLSDWDLWETHGGTLRPLLPGGNLTGGRDQLWARRDAQHPWQLDLLLDRSEDEWVFKRPPSASRGSVPCTRSTAFPPSALNWPCCTRPTWDWPKDRADLAAARLDPNARAWLAHTLAQLDHHTWAKAARSAMDYPRTSRSAHGVP